MLMQSSALLISSIIRCTDLFLSVIVLPIISLEGMICSVVDPFGLFATCDDGISASSLSLILMMMHAVRILLREERKIIGLMFDGEPFALFVF